MTNSELPDNVTVLETEPRKILQRDVKQSEFAFVRMSVVLPLGWTFEDVKKPEFWVNIAHLFQSPPQTNEADRSGAIFEIRTQDHAFYAEVYVRAVHERGLTVGVLREPVYFGPQKFETPQYVTRWNVGARGFDVIRKTDNEIVSHAAQNKTKEMALAWIDDTVAAMKVG